jgi:O-succinylbenzoic acid--CoA ligase
VTIDRLLDARGVGAGDVVAVDAAASPEFMALMLACVVRGGTLLPCAPGLPPAVRAQLERTAGARCSLAAAEIASAAARSDAEASAHASTSPGAFPGAVPAHPSAAFAIATSGSSGVPRVIRVPWSAAHASAVQGAHAVPFGPGDAWHASLGCAHVGGLMILVRAAVLGGAVRFAPPPRSWSDLDGSTHVSVVAAQLSRLLEDPAAPPRSLRAVLLGGGPSPRALREEALRRGVPLHATYGLTETCSQVATVRLAPGDAETLAGPPIAPTSIVAVDGELVIDGPTLADAEFVDGRLQPLPRPLRTRDAGFVDERGRVHVVGRLDSMFISGGRNIHPETIERAIAGLAGVRAVCVVGIPHPRWGMRPAAFVDSAAPAARPLRTQLEGLLEPYLVPDAILAMPTEEAARMKPSRAALAARLAAGETFPRLE